MDPRHAMGVLFLGDRSDILEDVQLLFARGQLQLDGALSAPVREAELHRASCTHPRKLVVYVCASRFSVHLDDPVSNGDATALRIAIGVHGNDFGLAAEIGTGFESRRRSADRGLSHLQPHKLKRLVVGQLQYSGYVVLEKLSETLARDSFGRLLYSIGVGEEAAFLGIVLVHPPEQVAQRLPAVGELPNAQVQQHSHNFALVVVADAPLRRAVKRVALEPGVQARFLHRLPAVRRTRLQFVDLAGNPVNVLPVAEQSGPGQQHVAYGAGHAFAEPKGAGVHGALIIDRFQRLRPDALDVPQVKELVGADTGNRHQA